MIRFPSKNNGGGGDDGDNGAAACSKAKAGSLRSSEMEDFILSIRGVYICIDAAKSDGTR